MRMTRLTTLKLAGIAVSALAVTAAAVVFAPAVLGQSSNEPRPFFRFGGQGGEIGVVLRDLDDADLKREKLSSLNGAIVTDIRADSPAARAGFRAGDVVVTFDGEPVRSARHLGRLLSETPEGREVAAVVVRGGEKVTLKVAPSASGPTFAYEELIRPRAFRVPEIKVPDFKVPDFTEELTRQMPRWYFDNRDGRLQLFMAGTTRLGAEVQDLTSQLGDYFGTATGVLVTSVDDGTPGKTAGLKAGDVITRVNNESIRTAADLRRVMRALTGDVTIAVVRDRKEVTLKTKIDGGDLPVELPRRSGRRSL